MNTINTKDYDTIRRAHLTEVRRHNRRVRRVVMTVYTLFIVVMTVAVSFAAVNIAGYTITDCDYTKPAVVRERPSSSMYSEYADLTAHIPYRIEMNNVQFSAPENAPVAEEVKAVVETPAPVEKKEVVETPVVNESNWGYEYTQEDLEYLTMALVGECQNCTKEQQLDIGSVILNRMRNDKYFKYATTVKKTVLAKGQYACFTDGNAYRTPTELNKEVARELLENGPISPANVLFQANFPQGDGVYKYYPEINTYLCYKN